MQFMGSQRGGHDLVTEQQWLSYGCNTEIFTAKVWTAFWKHALSQLLTRVLSQGADLEKTTNLYIGIMMGVGVKSDIGKQGLSEIWGQISLFGR